MKSYDSKTYSVNDFREWNERKQLTLQPRFQRRQVWTQKARSYLMDTIVRGKPMPKVFIRQWTDPDSRKTIREVVDGQQRLTSILGFINDEFTIAKIHNEEFANIAFSDMPEVTQSAILDYEISVDVLLGVDDQDVLDIFARINSYSVNLNQQEQLNAQYFGEFKQAVSELSLEYISYWRSLPFLGDQSILRMAEAELVSDLIIALSDGVKAKRAIPTYYKRYDDHFPRRELRLKQFRVAMDILAELMIGRKESNYIRRIHLFYTLFTSICHMQFGIQNITTPRKPIKVKDFPHIIDRIGAIDITFSMPEEELSREQRQFLIDSRRATTDEAVRIRRTDYTIQNAFMPLEWRPG